MRWRSIFWILVSVACFLGALLFWRLGDRWQQQGKKPTAAAPTTTEAGGVKAVTTVQSASTAPIALLDLASSNNPAAMSEEELLRKYRLSNTTVSMGKLVSSDQAILLANAIIDLDQPLSLNIPDQLKAKDDPGAYIVQSRGAVGDRFRAQLRGAGAAIVSYIPNNAFLVRISADGAQQLRSMPGVQAVLPYEPYYKIPNLRLLQFAVEGLPMPPDTALDLLAFPDARDATLEALHKANLEVVGEDRSPFGPVFKVRAEKDSLPKLAGLPSVQGIGIASPRRPANDLVRPHVGAAADSLVPTNYLGLSGLGIVVDVNDSGVDALHPDLFGRVTGDQPGSLTDTNGHGTHVAGIIGSSGGQSLTVTNVLGSIMPPVDGQFRGVAASNVQIYAVSLFGGSNYPAPTDFELQEKAGLTNALISNNSWNYGTASYDIAAASFDAAVRDTLPDQIGSQPVTFVFSAGNAGNGGDSGVGGTSGSILSPATAKNVITVGALEQFRNVTNITERVQNGSTNFATPWAGQSDSDNEVAGFSSRGNVGIHIEGDFGRFKPDIVAPGVFVVSTTEKDHWDQLSYYNVTNFHTIDFIDDIEPGTDLDAFPLQLPYNTVRDVTIRATAIYPQLDLPVYYRRLFAPSAGAYDLLGTNLITVTDNGGPTGYLPVPAQRNYGVGNPTNRSVRFEITVNYLTTNDNGNYFQVLSNLNTGCGPYYRYESGTSMSAAGISGMLALIGDFFTNRLALPPPSPALLKALLINGARTPNDIYDLNVNKSRNFQGWGLANLTNSIPQAITNGVVGLPAGPKAATMFFEQDPANALATGQSHTFNIQVNPQRPEAFDQPLRITLVWTDPPGNPVSGIKLVNNLDLIVTNLDSSNPAEQIVYYGNDIPNGSSFTFPSDTNLPPVVDNVNNVENVYIVNPVGTNYSITVVGKRVNVNAVTQHPDNVAQDYALVISSGDGAFADAISIVQTNAVAAQTPLVTTMTNQFGTNQTIAGQILLHQRVGANSPLIGANGVGLDTNTVWGAGGTNGAMTVGTTNQWHFYVITNATTFTNAAFGTFLPSELAVGRMGVTNTLFKSEATRLEADIDLYVSTDPGLLDLDPTAIANSFKALKRGGTETLFLSAVPGQIYYAAVKAEDQEAGEYGFFGLFSLRQFGQKDSDGFYQCYMVPEEIPDGNPALPGGTKNLLILVPDTLTVRRAVVLDSIEHEVFGDLVGTISHDGVSVILNNHSCFFDGLTCATNHTYLYDDSGERDFDGIIHPNLPVSQHTDGPGTLNTFMGSDGSGQWWLTEVDNAQGNTGSVLDYRVRLDPIIGGTNGTLLDIAPNSFGFLAVDIPPEATNVTICIQNESTTPLQLQLYARYGDLPSLTTYDYTQTINPPGDCMIIDGTTFPPLHPGRLFIGVYNPNPISQRARVIVTMQLDVNAPYRWIFTAFGPLPLLDDAITYSSLYVPHEAHIVRAEVGVVLNHPRVSDMALTLISPSGKRILLFENRGGPDAVNMGDLTVVTNYFGTQLSGGQNASTNILRPVPAVGGSLIIDYDFLAAPDTMDVYYDGTNIFHTGLLSGAGSFTIPYGPGFSTNIVIVMNQDNNPNNPDTVWMYTPRVISEKGSYFLFSENTNYTQIPIKFFQPPFMSVDTVVTNAIEPCPAPTTNTGWTQWTNGHWYKAVAVPGLGISWDGANQVASDQCAHLATITSSNENAFVFSLVNSNGFFNGVSGPALGGMLRSGTSNVWEWVNGEGLFGYTNWLAGRPTTNSIVNRLRFQGTVPGVPAATWGDVRENIRLPGYVMERDYSPQIIAGPILNPTNNHFYYLLGTNTWQNGEAGAVALGGHLVSMNDAAENLWVNANVVVNPGIHPYIGLVNPTQGDVHDNNNWQWSSGELLTYTNWGPGEPNFPFEFFGNMFPDGTWNNTTPTDLLMSVAEVPGTITVKTNFGAAVFPEESLQSLVGDVAKGNWTLEMWDNRAGATNPQPIMVAWQLRLVLDLPIPAVTPLTPGIPYTNTIPSCQIQYFSVDVPDWANYVTNTLLFANPPPGVRVWYGQFGPSTNNLIIANGTAPTTGGNFVLSSGTNVPVLVPGGRYFLAVENPCTGGSGTNETFAIRVDLGIDFIGLTNGIPYTNSLAGLGTVVPNALAAPKASQVYRYQVTNAIPARAQFEIEEYPGQDLILVARLGLPPPNEGLYDYISSNPTTNGELIVVFTNSTPIPLIRGDWYLTAINNSTSTNPAPYTIKATEWPVTGRPFSITNYAMTTNEFCVTWNSLPGVHYYIQGAVSLSPWLWYKASPTITATSSNTSYCVPLPSPFHFFRVTEGLSLIDVLEPTPQLSIANTTNGPLLNWIGSVNAEYEAQWAPFLPPTWTSFTNVMTTTNGSYFFLDDGTQTGGFDPMRFYRVHQLLW